MSARVHSRSRSRVRRARAPGGRATPARAATRSTGVAGTGRSSFQSDGRAAAPGPSMFAHGRSDTVTPMSEIEDELAIRRLTARYCHVVDEQRMEDLVELFTDDATVDILGTTYTGE